ncbi:MAG: PTS glucose/sucrose transporter subunit IIB [bacterium]|nr:PTS glucose/sucrose transporter subunit IIB [bacterium]
MSNAQQILAALGGSTNVNDITSCITRLRVNVADAEVVSEDALKDAGAFGVVVHGHTVQVVVGPQADDLAAEISEIR